MRFLCIAKKFYCRSCSVLLTCVQIMKYFVGCPLVHTLKPLLSQNSTLSVLKQQQRIYCSLRIQSVGKKVSYSVFSIFFFKMKIVNTNKIQKVVQATLRFCWTAYFVLPCGCLLTYISLRVLSSALWGCVFKGWSFNIADCFWVKAQVQAQDIKSKLFVWSIIWTDALISISSAEAIKYYWPESYTCWECILLQSIQGGRDKLWNLMLVQVL